MFTPTSICAVKFFKLSISCVPFPGMYSTHNDIPGYVQEWEKNQEMAIKSRWMCLLCTHTCRYNKMLSMVQQNRGILISK